MRRDTRGAGLGPHGAGPVLACRPVGLDRPRHPLRGSPRTHPAIPLRADLPHRLGERSMVGDGSSRLRTAGQVTWLLVMAAVFLSPALQTGYWADDLYQSVFPHAVMLINKCSFFDVASNHVKSTLLAGRFFPLTAALISTVHYLISDVWQYKAYIIATSILDLFLFYLLVRKLSGRRDYACFAACVTVGLIQYRFNVDPSIGFFGQMQLLIAAL